ncbi:MAG: hypothetical protein GWM98_06270 [Nitrospinaceae bacterium]|nr:hypothetical protein [Nitrospinaceae bacterium]NIR56879.1 hypothetical protein [Nitrospinaceae bacterium]NIS84582.1 hypothetical protein [Nitrospinaceae bacterium]NIT81374.1 hypothetical protein [Nitrospinaceae bacterium]NIU43661.1 hypothetical protein [Nitrospinaceae bacterium]
MSGIHLLQLVLVVAILVLVGIPLFSKLPRMRLFKPLDPTEEEYKHLLVRKEEVLLSIKELEFDFKTDKISKPDFDALHKKLEQEALDVLDKIDDLEKQLKKKKKAASPARTV